MDKILLLDSLNLIHRANIKFGAKPGDEDKQSFTVVFNFFRSLRALIEEFDPDKVFFVREGKNNFRYGLYPEYKANRLIKTGDDKKLKDKADFDRQKDIVYKLVSYLPITQVVSEGFEADDTIYSLCQNLREEQVVIISSDSDFTQILQLGLDNVRLYDPRKKVFIEAPDYSYLIWKCIAGDKSDNVPSVLSNKKAIEIAMDIKKFEEFASQEEQRASFSLNKQLIELQIVPDEQLEFIDYSVDYNGLLNEFVWMEFSSMIEDKYWNKFVKTFKNLR
jgi:5'-3' exonuclease